MTFELFLSYWYVFSQKKKKKKLLVFHQPPSLLSIDLLKEFFFFFKYNGKILDNSSLLHAIKKISYILPKSSFHPCNLFTIFSFTPLKVVVLAFPNMTGRP